MRIAVYHNLAFGGALRVVHEQIRHLSREHNVDLYSFDFDRENIYDFRNTADSGFDFENYCDSVFRLDDPCYRWPRAVTARFARPYLKSVDLARLDRGGKAIAGRMNGSGYDLVLAHPDRLTQAPLFLRYLRVPSIYYLQEPNRTVYDRAGDIAGNHSANGRGRAGFLVSSLKQAALFPYIAPLRRLDRINTLHASVQLANSSYSKEFIDRSYGIDAGVCYLGVDTDVFKPAEVQREDQIVFVSAVSPNKGQDLAVRALARIPAESRPRLVLCFKDANIAYLEHLTDMAARLGVRLDLVHGSGDREVALIYNRSLFAVYTPVREPFGLVPLEAMACGTPVIGVREGGVPETIVDIHTGLLVNRDVRELAAAMQRLISDESLRSSLAANCASHVQKNWTWGKSMDRLERYIQELVPSGVTRDGDRP